MEPIMIVAGAQLEVTDQIDANVASIARAIAFAVESDADILLTPEGAVSGYRPDFNPAEATEAVDWLVTQASENRLGLALGTCMIEPSDGRCYNQLRFYDKRGQFLGFHSKILRCSSLDDPPVGEINDYATSPLRTFDFHGVTVGGLICNDMWGNPGCTPMDDPHLSQQLARLGAQVIFHAVNSGRDGSEFDETVTRPFHESNLQLRTQAGKVWTVVADNSYPEQWPTNCPSGVINPAGEWVVQLPESGEHFFVCQIEPAAELKSG